MMARRITRKVSPNTFATNDVADNRDYADLLREMMDDMNDHRGIAVILTPGRYNSAFFEHSYFAEKTGATLAYPGDLFVEDDKGIYYFVPKMVKYYLGEDSVLQNAPTYLPYFKQDYDYVMENLDKLVIKDVSEAGGYGVVFGSELPKEKLEELRQLIVKFPRRWIAQEVVDFKDLEILEGEELVWRKADLRAFVVTGKETKVWKSGLTRFSRNPDSFVVNSSQGGGFKDTWVMKVEN